MTLPDPNPQKPPGSPAMPDDGRFFGKESTHGMSFFCQKVAASSLLGEDGVCLRFSQKVPFAQWQDALNDPKVKTAIARRLYRMAQGNFGDCKPCRDGIWELRINLGPGYRVYYAMDGKTVVLLLCAGSKRTQQADIVRACEYWNDWKTRKH